MESPLYKVDIDYSNVKGISLNDSYLVTKFINDSTASGPVEITINRDYVYTLQGLASTKDFKALSDSVKEAEKKLDSLLFWRNKCREQGIDERLIGNVSVFVHRLYTQAQELKGGTALTDVEISNLIKQILPNFTQEINSPRGLEDLLVKRNSIEATIEELLTDQKLIEHVAKSRVIKYLYLILLISAIHISTFYYMIFHVDWLGWDIIEPITYTVMQITVLLSMRFFFKYQKARSTQTIIESFMKNRISRDPRLKEKYENTCKLLERNLKLREIVTHQIQARQARQNYLRDF